MKTLVRIAAFVALVLVIGNGCRPPVASPVSSPAAASPETLPVAVAKPADEDTATGRELYLRYCGACHGTDGDGQGVAARFLFPKPRNFCSSRFRLVSTTSGVPTPTDLDKILLGGVPGTAMPSFRQFGDAARSKLIDEVLRLRREGMREVLAQMLQSEGDAIDAGELQELLDLRLTPGPAVAVPAFGPVTPALVRQGQEIFAKQGCPRCHGSDGTGDTGLCLADDEGYPTRPRNLVWEEFKGGNDSTAVYVRILLGMPGTPMAANPNLSPPELVAVVHFCRSLGRDPKWQLTNHQRAKRVLDRGFLSPGRWGHTSQP
jgi:mono/diheme cytochrome c family protein